MVSLSFPIAAPDKWPQGWGFMRTPSGQQFMMGAYDWRGRRVFRPYDEIYGWLRFNPRCTAADAAARFHRVLEEVWGVMEHKFRPVFELEMAKVTRLDIARDFSIRSDPGDLIDALQRIPRPHAPSLRVWSDPSTGKSQTLNIGTKTAGLLRIYDASFRKSQTLGVELQARKNGWLPRYGKIVSPGDVTPEAVTRLFRNRWEHARLGTALMSESHLVDLVYELDIPSEHERDAFIGYLVQMRHGKERNPAPATRAKYNRWITQLDALATHLNTPERRLDLASGREVIPSGARISRRGRR